VAAKEGGGIDPIHQFQIAPWFEWKPFGFDATFTNSSAFMLAAVAAISLFLILGISGRALIPSRLQSLVEMFYQFIAGIVRDTIGEEGMKFFPFVFALFSFVLFCNLLGMLPLGFTVTSHIIVTFALAMLVFVIVVGYGLWKNGVGFFKLFVPDAPVILLPLMVPIEIISFLARPMSLSVRLFANMLAGHITLKVFASFIVALGSLGFVGILGAILPLLMTVALTALEFLVAFLQAFIFALLTSVYLHDAEHPGH
jgi:F-type H+-transporting ATPase subunit a